MSLSLFLCDVPTAEGLARRRNSSGGGGGGGIHRQKIRPDWLYTQCTPPCLVCVALFYTCLRRRRLRR